MRRTLSFEQIEIIIKVRDTLIHVGGAGVCVRFQTP